MTRLFVVLFWCLGIGGFLSAQASSPELLTVYFSEKPPLCMVDGQRGSLLVLTKACLAEAGLKARFIELPPRRILDLLRSGPSDALGVGWFKIQGREDWARYSQPIYQDKPLVALVNSRAAPSLPAPLRLDALLSSGLTLGLTADESLGAEVDEKIRTVGIVPLETLGAPASLVKMVSDGRMDYTLMSEDEASYLVAHAPDLAPGLVVARLLDPPPGNRRHFLYPANFEPAIVGRIDQALDRLKASGRYQALISVD